MASDEESKATSDSFLRSDLLVLCELVLPAEVAFECLVALGNATGPVHIGCDSAGSGPGMRTARTVSAVSQPTKQCRDLLMTLGSIKEHLAVHREYISLHREDPIAEQDAEALAVGLKPKLLYDLEVRTVVTVLCWLL